MGVNPPEGIHCAIGNCSVRLQIFKAASMKKTVFWDIASRSLVKSADVSEVLTAFIIRYDTTQCNIPEGCHLDNCSVVDVGLLGCDDVDL
jgi:hypothetical protein